MILPAGALWPGRDNVIAVLVENTGNPEGPSGEKASLYSAALNGSSAPIAWRLEGDPGGTTLQDPVRGVMNPAGLYGSDNGWDLPGCPDQDWQSVTLPDSWPARGVPRESAGTGPASRSACRAIATCPLTCKSAAPDRARAAPITGHSSM